MLQGQFGEPTQTLSKRTLSHAPHGNGIVFSEQIGRSKQKTVRKEIVTATLRVTVRDTNIAAVWDQTVPDTTTLHCS